jgi:uncharacterized protein YeaO (DUF488 family)
MRPELKIKRVYDAPAGADGERVLVDRLWPRGLTKEKAKVAEWAKDLAPSDELRKWFHHEERLWGDFEKRYKAELKKNDAAEAFCEAHRGVKVITLVYSARDEEHNQAIVLREYLEKLFGE